MVLGNASQERELLISNKGFRSWKEDLSPFFILKLILHGNRNELTNVVNLFACLFVEPPGYLKRLPYRDSFVMRPLANSAY